VKVIATNLNMEICIFRILFAVLSAVPNHCHQYEITKLHTSRQNSTLASQPLTNEVLQTGSVSNVWAYN
jgi:hypothetical protein